MQQWKKLASSSVLLSFNLRKYSVLTINHVSHNIYNAECYVIILHPTDNIQDKYGGLVPWAHKAFDKWDIPEIAAHFPSTFPAPYLSHSRAPRNKSSNFIHLSNWILCKWQVLISCLCIAFQAIYNIHFCQNSSEFPARFNSTQSAESGSLFWSDRNMHGCSLPQSNW